jgi:hypothetical protein
MSADGRALQTLAFGDLDAGVWGAALLVPGEPPFVCVAAAGAVVCPDARLAGRGSDEDWQLSGAGIELTVAGAGKAVGAERPGSELGGFDQLCRLSGRLALDGTTQEVSSLGCRAEREGEIDFSRYASLREISAWFEPGDGLALAALRPRRSKGQEADLVSAAVLDSEHSGAVEDPRLSTTYTAEGWPARASLELWLAGDDDQQLLRRVSGEAAGSQVASERGNLDVRAGLFRWYTRGHEGAGVYLLAARG